MLPTLRALCDSLPSELAVIAPSPAPAVEIQAVHVSELLQPARYLDGGELLITSGMNIPPTAEACATYTRQLAHANVAALAFGTGVIHPDVPRLLIQGATAAGLPLLRVLPGTAYLTITRKYWQLRAESDQRELVRTLNSHRALVAAALGDGGESAIVRRWPLAYPAGRPSTRRQATCCTCGPLTSGAPPLGLAANSVTCESSTTGQRSA